MLNFLYQTVEFQQWGYNAETFGSIAVAVLTFIELYALFMQNKSIREQSSGESLNVLLPAYACLLSFATAVYGLEVGSMTLVWNGASAGLLGALVLGGLYRFKKFTKMEHVLVPMFVLLPILMLLPQRQLLYAIIPFGFVITTGMQLRELLATKKRGVVELPFLGGYAILSGSWVVFGIALGDWAVWVPQVLLCTLFLANIVAWHRARE